MTTFNNKIAKPSTDFIWGDFISHKICDDLIDFYHTQDYLKPTEGMVLEQGVRVVRPERKESTDLSIPYYLNHPAIQAYSKALQGILNRYQLRFPFCETAPYKVTSPYSFQWYPKGGGFKIWHTERNNAHLSNVYRHLVFMTYLTDAPGGGTEWFHQDKYVDAQKGMTVIWPSDWTHLHRGRVTKDHEKIIITGWFSFN